MISPLMAKRLGDKAKTFPVFDYGDEDRFFYAPKASREEREAGCEHLPGKTQAETVDREPGAPGGNNPRAGAGRENGKGAGVKVRNFHPT
jgi:site-specific DNA-methyltransferase (adenine-specific)